MESTRALVCLGNWSLLEFVKNLDVKAVAQMPDVSEHEEEELEEGWDSILL